jgi:hypothetical protein
VSPCDFQTYCYATEYQLPGEAVIKYFKIGGYYTVGSGENEKCRIIPVKSLTGRQLLSDD